MECLVISRTCVGCDVLLYLELVCDVMFSYI